MMNCVLGEDWNGISEIIPYGLGAEGSRCIDKIMKDFSVPFIIDNSPAKAGTKYNGVDILSWDNAKDVLDDRKIVVTTRYRNFMNIAKSLADEGKQLYKDFCNVKEFIPEWYWKNRKECCLYTVDMTVATQCTFNCKNCNMFMPYYLTKSKYSLDELKMNIDQFFKVVDYICYIGLIGGEPFLCEHMKELIEYSMETYKGKLGGFGITSNGSILPNPELRKTLKKYNVLVAVSDYGDESPCREKMKQTIEVLEKEGIYCDVRRSLEWRDVGFPVHPTNFSDEDVAEHMKKCSADWRGLNEGKFYYCNVAFSAQKSGRITLEKNEYLDLESIFREGIDGKKRLLEYNSGKVEKGYLSFCKLCGGCGKDNKNLVKAGVQI